MNAADRKEFDIIHTKIDDIKKDIDEMNVGARAVKDSKKNKK